MKFTLVSDLHLLLNSESFSIRVQNTDGADVLVIAGDLVEIGQIIPSGKLSRAKPRPNASQVAFEFLNHAASEFPVVIWVFGNHEYWGTDITRAVDDTRQWLISNGLTNVHILDDSSLIVNGVMFHGTTLWTDMKRQNRTVMKDIEHNVNDYSAISEGEIESITTKLIYTKHKSSMRWLDNALTQCNEVGIPSVVVTHHHPSNESTAAEYKGNNIRYAYCSNLSEFIETHTNVIKYWCCGHIHEHLEYKIGNSNVTLLCNPRGYVGQECLAYTFTPTTYTVE